MIEHAEDLNINVKTIPVKPGKLYTFPFSWHGILRLYKEPTSHLWEGVNRNTDDHSYYMFTGRVQRVNDIWFIEFLSSNSSVVWIRRSDLPYLVEATYIEPC